MPLVVEERMVPKLIYIIEVLNFSNFFSSFSCFLFLLISTKTAFEQAFKKVLLIDLINKIVIVKYNEKSKKDKSIHDIKIIILLKIKYDFLL